MTPITLASWVNAASAAFTAFDLDEDGYPLDMQGLKAAEDLDEFIDRIAGCAIERFGPDTEDYRAFYDACEKKGGLCRPRKPIDWNKAPPEGTYAFTAWLMAQGGDEEECGFWDDWKDQMKEGALL